jgi:hypothetical protein
MIEAQKIVRELRGRLGASVTLGSKQTMLFADEDDVEKYLEALEVVEGRLQFEIENPIHLDPMHYTSVPKEMETSDSVL